MFKFFNYIVKNMANNPVRTVLTVFGVGLAAFIAIYLIAVFDSRNQAVAKSADTLLVVNEKDVYWPTKSELPGDVDMAQRIEREVSYAIDAAPVFFKQNLWASSGGGLVKIVGIDKNDLRDFIDIDVAPEAWERFLSQRNAALLGCDFVTTFKDRYIWEVGKEFVMADFTDMSLYMAGVFTPRDPTYRTVILTGRTFLQEVEEKRGIGNQIYVKLDNRQNAGAAIEAIEGISFPVKIHVEPAQDALDKAIDDLNDMLLYATYVIAFTGLVILLCLANTISMSTYDRAQEIGVLRSLGFERPRVLKLVLVESALLGLVGGALGCLAAYLVLTLGNQQFSMRGFTIPLVMRPSLLAVGIGASLVVGLVGGFLPAVRASRLNIVEALRKVD